MRGSGRFVPMKVTSLFISTALAVAACGPSETNAPTEPAEPIDTPAADAPPAAARPGGVGAMLPGAGPQSFVGRWAANVAWCPNTQGPEQPIEITPTRFIGYENSCTIATVDQTGEGYDAALRCQAEGQTSIERVRMVASGQTLQLTYLDRDNATISLTKCTTLGDTASSGPSLKLD